MVDPFIERARKVVTESALAVHVLLSSDNADVQLLALRPVSESLPEELTTGKWRSVGVLGLQGLKPLCAFDEPLPPNVVNGIVAAFLEYARVLLGGQFAEHVAAAESAELARMYSLPDLRQEC